MNITTAVSVPAKTPVKVLMVLLHGYGADGANLIDIGQVWGEKFPELECIAPNAPFICEQGMGYQWASLQHYTPEKMASDIQPIFAVLKDYIDQELKKRNLTYKNLIIMGFSQGAYLALHTGLFLSQQGATCAGIMAYAGWMHFSPDLHQPSLTYPPVLLVHGTADTVVPLSGSTTAEYFFRQLGVYVSLHECRNLGHSINKEGLQQGEIFIKAILSNINTL